MCHRAIWYFQWLAQCLSWARQMTRSFWTGKYFWCTQTLNTYISKQIFAHLFPKTHKDIHTHGCEWLLGRWTVGFYGDVLHQCTGSSEKRSRSQRAPISIDSNVKMFWYNEQLLLYPFPWCKRGTWSILFFFFKFSFSRFQMNWTQLLFICHCI